MIDEGHKVEMMDVNVYRWSPQEILEKISKSNFDVVGIGGLSTTYSFVKWITLELKKMFPDIPIIAGGYVATPIPKIIFEKTGIDVICYGEAELTVKELLEKLERGHEINSVRGLYIKTSDGFIQAPSRPLIKNLDEIPIPKSVYKLLPMETYIENSLIGIQGAVRRAGLSTTIDINKVKSFALLTGRGCIGNCTFCYRMIKGYRKHSVEYVIEHLKYLIDRYGINDFTFCDELFTASSKWVNEFCNRLIDENLNIHFRTSVRVDSVNRDVIRKMKEAGCYSLSYGFESCSQKMLDNMNKRTTVEQNYKAARMTMDEGLFCSPTFIVGIPGENESTIQETIKFIQGIGFGWGGVFFATPFPGTKLYDYALKKGLIKDEEKFIEKLDEASHFLINMSELSNEDLKKYRYLVMYELRKNAVSKFNGFKYISGRLKLSLEKTIVTTACDLKLYDSLVKCRVTLFFR